MISVIIPSYFRAKYLIQTIKEVIKQNHSAVLEIIVIDQTDRADFGVEHWKQMEAWIKNDIVVYKHLEKANANRARNLGLSLANGEIVLFLDDDVLLPSNFIELHYQMYQTPHQGRKVIAVGGMSYHRQDKCKGFTVDKINLSNYKLYASPDFAHYKKKIEYLKLDETLVGCNMSVMKKYALDIYGFDENFTSYYDEADFCFRLKEKINVNKEAILINKNAYLIHLRAIAGGHRLREDKLKDELYRQLSFNLFYIRHYPFWQIFPQIIKHLRVGPFKKSNFLNFRKFWTSLYYYFVSIRLAFKLKHNVKSPFQDK